MATTQSNYKRAYAAGHFALELENKAGGWLFSVDGGMAQAEVVNEKIGPEHLIHKHISAVKYEDITVTCGPAMSREFYNWITDSFKGDYSRQHGAIISANYDFKEMTRLDFYQGLVTEVGFPALDAASREMARLTVKISPEYTRLKPPSGESIAGSKYPIDPTTAKRWLVRNFRISIDGIDCTRVTKVEAITIKQKVTEVPLGEFRDPYREPTVIEYPNVVLSLPESHAEDFFKWYNNFVIDGNCDRGDEKHGSIEFLHEDMQTVACQIDLQHLGIFKVTMDKGEAGGDKIRTVKVEMYCEKMQFDIKQAYD
jgi:phage tail-like protein